MGHAKPSVTIIGTGALGSTLHKFFKENDYLIRSTWNSQGGFLSSDEAGEFHQIHSLLPKKENEIGDWVFITTPDDLISKTSQLLSQQSISWKNKVVIHCSGNLTADELNALSEKGANIISMHPIQTFKKGDGSGRFRNIYISLQGDKEAKKQLQPLIEEMGANSILLDKKQKRYLHIASVMASNYLVALMFSVENLLNDVQLDAGFDSIEVLIHQTVSNIFEKGSSRALTGPVSRGDSETVKTHLNELKSREQEKLYKILGLEAVKIAEKSGSLTEKQLNSLKEVLFE